MDLSWDKLQIPPRNNFRPFFYKNPFVSKDLSVLIKLSGLFTSKVSIDTVENRTKKKKYAANSMSDLSEIIPTSKNSKRSRRDSQKKGKHKLIKDGECVGCLTKQDSQELTKLKQRRSFSAPPSLLDSRYVRPKFLNNKGSIKERFIKLFKAKPQQAEQFFIAMEETPLTSAGDMTTGLKSGSFSPILKLRRSLREIINQMEEKNRIEDFYAEVTTLEPEKARRGFASRFSSWKTSNKSNSCESNISKSSESPDVVSASSSGCSSFVYEKRGPSRLSILEAEVKEIKSILEEYFEVDKIRPHSKFKNVLCGKKKTNKIK